MLQSNFIAYSLGNCTTKDLTDMQMHLITRSSLVTLIISDKQNPKLIGKYSPGQQKIVATALYRA